jgi:hypothetical protein
MGQSHGPLKICQALELDVSADGVQQPTDEVLYLLRQRQWPGVRHPSLERLLALPHGPPKWKTRQVGKVVGAEPQPEALVAQGLEEWP